MSFGLFESIDDLRTIERRNRDQTLLPRRCRETSRRAIDRFSPWNLWYRKICCKIPSRCLNLRDTIPVAVSRYTPSIEITCVNSQFFARRGLCIFPVSSCICALVVTRGRRTLTNRYLASSRIPREPRWLILAVENDSNSTRDFRSVRTRTVQP